MKHRISNRNLPQRFLKARECLMTHFRPILHRFGLTDQQWRVLRVLDEHGPLEPREICSHCQIHSASMAGVLARLEEQAIILRQRVASDQRRVVVRLSPKGDQLTHDIAPLVELQYQQLEQALGAPVLDGLFEALEAFLALQNKPVPLIELPPDTASGSGA